MKIKIEEVPNKAMLYFHVNKIVSTELIVDLDTSEHLKDEWDVMNESKYVPEKLIALTEALFAIAGITSLGFDKYEIAVEKGECFTWDEITPEVIKVITFILGEGESIE
jgi:hypothetical protein